MTNMHFGVTIPRTVAFFLTFTLILSACSTSNANYLPSQANEINNLPQPGANPPVIRRVEERQQVVDGYLWYFQDIYFSDADGDASRVTHELASTSLSYVPELTDDPIEASPEQQKAEALFTVSGKCWQKMELSFESRIMDQSGNLSEPMVFSMSCTAPQPLDRLPLLVPGLLTAFVITLLLVLGFWLLFRKRPGERLPALRSTLLLFFLFMVLRFFQLLVHEAGHALYPLVNGIPNTLYIHPFAFRGFSRPFVFGSSAWYHVLGSAAALSVALLVFLLFWKRRSTALLPLAMLFPYIAITDGINVMGIQDDFRNLVQTTGLPAVPFLILGALIFVLGLISMLSLLPFAGLDPRQKDALFVLPAAMFLNCIISFLVMHLVVPGSPINNEYFMASEILSDNLFITWSIYGIVLAVLYVTFFRRLFTRLPAWLHAEVSSLTWKDLLIPGILWAVSVLIGLAIII